MFTLIKNIAVRMHGSNIEKSSGLSGQKRKVENLDVEGDHPKRK